MKELIGRSRNERKLDGIYNKQRDVLINQHKNNLNKYNNDIYSNLSKRKVNESIPFPEIYENKKKKINNETSISDDKKKHDVAKDKEDKNNPETLKNENHNTNGNDNAFVITNTEETKNNNSDKSIDNNDEVSLHKNETSQHSPELTDNEKDTKNDEISNQTNLNNEENNFDKKKKNTINITKEEKKFLKALKIKLYYLIILFKLNDNFVFNKLMSIYRQIFEEIQNEYNTFEEQITQDKEKENILKDQTGKEMDTKTNESDPKHIDHMNAFDEQQFILIKDQWEIPNEYEIYKIKRNAFVKCLSYLINFINLNWAKTLVESLLQDVYLKKYIFDTCDEIIIENLQSTVKSNINKRKNKNDSYHVLSIGESLNPIKDAREEKIVSLHGSHVWSNKQMER